MDRKEANKAASNSRQFNKSVYELQDAMNKNQPKAEVKRILVSNPKLMAAYIKEKSKYPGNKKWLNKKSFLRI